MENKTENQVHWAEEKEAVKSSGPVKLIFLLLKYLPDFIVYSLVFPVGFFYLLFSKRAQKYTKLYQKQLKEFTNGEVPKRISPYKQIVSFAICLIEKISGWLGKIKFSEIRISDDDCPALLKDLDEGKGALFITSHLGNMELLRSLSSFNQNGCSRNIPVSVVMTMNVTEIFSQTLKEINPNYSLNIIDANTIGVNTIFDLQERIERGEVVVIAGDRTSPNARNRISVKNFLGKKAPFPYGAFLTVSLLNVPTYYVFGLRAKTITIHPKNKIVVHKSKVNLDRPRNELEEMFSELTEEFIFYLEKYCREYPYQWYNFHDFWYLDETADGTTKAGE